MDNGVHFISGLPRSGSSLLSAILLQNPRFHAGISSPVAGLFQVLTHQMSGDREASILIDEEARRQVLHGLASIRPRLCSTPTASGPPRPTRSRSFIRPRR